MARSMPPSIMSLNDIASLLVCKISKVLPEHPVVSEDGELYDHAELEALVRRTGTIISFHSCNRIKQIIEMLLASGQVIDEYIGAWAKSEHSGDDCNNEAVALTEKSQAGDTKSMIELAECYLVGMRGVEKDETKAFEWFDKAADIGDDLGAARKADCLLRGVGVDRDYGEAYETLKEETDSVNCLLRLWYYHSKGIHGFKMDEAKASTALERIRNVEPGLSDDTLQNMKKELINLLNGEIFVKVLKDSPQKISVQTGEPLLSEVKTGDQDNTASSSECPRYLDTASIDNITSQLSSNDEQDDIGVITEPSVSQDVLKAKTVIEPMPAIPGKPDTDIGVTAQPQTETPEINSRNQSTASLHVKKCFECGIQKTQRKFSPSQWKRTKGSGRCIACVSKCAQWQSSNMSSANLQTKVCKECQQQKQYPDFAQNQWRRPVGTGRCRECVEKGLM